MKHIPISDIKGRRFDKVEEDEEDNDIQDEDYGAEEGGVPHTEGVPCFEPYTPLLTPQKVVLWGFAVLVLIILLAAFTTPV